MISVFTKQIITNTITFGVLVVSYKIGEKIMEKYLKKESKVRS